jgi:hypothetical protein
VNRRSESVVFGRKERNLAWRSRYPDRATCVRCLEEKELDGMDRLLWCEECRRAARQRAGRWGWAAGGILALGLALWIWLFIRPSDLVIGGWIATVVAALLIGSRVAREIAYGVMRFNNRNAVEAVPPGSEG